MAGCRTPQFREIAGDDMAGGQGMEGVLQRPAFMSTGAIASSLRRERTMKSLIQKLLFVFVAMTSTPVGMHAASAGVMTPVSVTGFASDVIVEAGATEIGAIDTLLDYMYDPHVTSVGTGDIYGYYEKGLFSAYPTWGQPTTTVNSHCDADTTLRLASFTSSNALLIDGDASGYETGTLTLVSPGKFGKLALFGTSTQGTKTLDYTLNYSDATTSTGSISFPDWFSSATNVAINEHSRARFSIDAGDIEWVLDPNTATRTDGANIYQVNISNVNPSKTLSSITLTGATTGETVFGGTAVFALSGEVAVPEPGSFAMVLSGLAALTAYALRSRK